MNSSKKLAIFAIVLSIMACREFPETPAEQKAFLAAEGEQVAVFYTMDNNPKHLYVEGVIYGNTLVDLKKALAANPQAQTLIMLKVPGSVDDEINLQASLLLREHGLNTHVPENGWVSSGGTDMFLAGVKRTAHKNARFGVHSWAEGNMSATELPREHEAHRPYLDYYRKIGIPESFYWYTLEAAPVDAMHWMTPEELRKYRVINPENL